MAISIRSSIQAALKTYIDTQITDVDIRDLRDNTDKRQEKAVYIHVSPEVVSDIAVTWYEMDVELHAVTYITDDKDHSELDAIYGNLFEIAHDLINGSASITVSGLTVLKWLNNEQGQDSFPIDENFQASIIKLKLFVELTNLTT